MDEGEVMSFPVEPVSGTNVMKKPGHARMPVRLNPRLKRIKTRPSDEEIFGDQRGIANNAPEATPGGHGESVVRRDSE
jgi:hypothetical protein